jgi:hypothetical protein
MFDSFATPTSELALTILTAELAIEGTVKTRVRRLVDLFNEPGAEHLVVEDAMFLDLESGNVLARAAEAQLRLEDLLLAHSRVPRETAALREPKQPVTATLLAPPFTVEGTVYLPFESELRMALDAYVARFVAVTEARYWLKGEADSPISVDLLIVNHARAHVSIAHGVQWSGASGPPPEDSGQNPW